VTSRFMLGADGATSKSQAQRSRIIVMRWSCHPRGGAGRVLLSFDSIAEMFKQRASFDQSYDEAGSRFGRHILGAEMALDLPFGIGPLQSTLLPERHPQLLPERLHVGGWLSDLLSRAGVRHLGMAFRYIFVRVPWAADVSGDLAAFPRHVGESFIIDTDHWRHFWMMLGAMWGLFAAAQRWMANAPTNAAPAS